MDGKNLINVLQGVGSFEYKNITVLFALIRCFLMVNPSRLRFIRRPYQGICEPMSASFTWIWHRIAFSDVNFFEHLLVFLDSDTSHRKHYCTIVPILENLLRYCVCVPARNGWKLPITTLNIPRLPACRKTGKAGSCADCPTMPSKRKGAWDSGITFPIRTRHSSPWRWRGSGSILYEGSS